MKNKLCTSIEQVQKLIELGIDVNTADMHYNNASIKGINYVDEYRAELMDYNNAIKVLSKYTINPLFEVIPCWSLTALLAAIPIEHNLHCFLTEDGTVYRVETIYAGNSKNCDNPVDACVNMIEKLNEQKLI